MVVDNQDVAVLTDLDFVDDIGGPAEVQIGCQDTDHIAGNAANRQGNSETRPAPRLIDITNIGRAA